MPDETTALPERYIEEISGKKLTAEGVAILLGRLPQHRPLGDSSIARVTSYLTAWANRIPNHDCRDFGKRLEIIDAAQVPYYRVLLKTQYESRMIERLVEQYDGSAMSEPRTTEQNVDVWSYSYQSVNGFKNDERVYRVDGSEILAPCSACEGHGRVCCPTCGGRGDVPCHACNGSGQVLRAMPVTRWRTVTKFQNGTTHEVNEPYETFDYFPVQCIACGQSGRVQCNGCGGTCLIVCPACGGPGKVVSYMAIRDSFCPESRLSICPNPSCAEDLHFLKKRL
jgi:hypothetical protein